MRCRMKVFLLEKEGLEYDMVLVVVNDLDNCQVNVFRMWSVNQQKRKRNYPFLIALQ